MRVEDVQQRFGDFREIVVDLLVDPSADEGKSLDQPFGMRVLALIGFEQQATGDLGVFLGKFRPHFANEGKLPLIVFQQRIVHRFYRLSMFEGVSRLPGGGVGFMPTGNGFLAQKSSGGDAPALTQTRVLRGSYLAITYSPRLASKNVSKVTGSVTGSATSRAEIRNRRLRSLAAVDST